MSGPITYPTSEVPGLLAAITASGYWAREEDGAWIASDAPSVQAIINGYNEFPATQQQAVAAAYAKLATIIAVGYTYNGVLIAIDDAGRADLTAMAAIASNTIAGIVTTAWPSTFAWAPKGLGASLPLGTPQSMIVFAAAAGHYVSANVQYAEALAQQIMAATTVAEVQTISITTGWPTS